MGTRAITHVFDGEKLLVSIYRQSDGYPTGHGAEIVEALGGRRLVNGIPGGSDYRSVVNGMGCAAALLIAHLKSEMEAGNIYVAEPDPTATEEYTYQLSGDTFAPEGGIRLKVSGWGGKPLFDGPISDFDPEAAEAA